MSRPYSQYSQPAYHAASPSYDINNNDDHYEQYNQGASSGRDKRYDPDYNDYDNPFQNHSRYEHGRAPDVNRGYSDDQFNVASDFNNEGPRYGELYGGQSRQEMAQLATGARPMST
jgi:hypothetical protein